MQNWMKPHPHRRQYNRTLTRLFKYSGAILSKNAAKYTFNGTFRYVADFFRYASVNELIEVYKRLKKRQGHTTEYAKIINSERADHPELADTPKAFFIAFEKLYNQHANAEQLVQNFIKTGTMRSQKKTPSARHMLYVYVMKYEDVKPSHFINVLYNALPASYKQENPSNLSPMTRKKRSSQ